MTTLQKKPAIWLILLLIGFPQLSETIFAPILPHICDFYHVGQGLSQATLSVYFLGFAFGVLFWGIAADKIGRRLSLLYGLVVYSVASFLCFATTDIYSLLFLRVLQAFGAAVGSIISQTMLRDLFVESSSRMRVFATVSGVIAFTPALGPVIGGVLISFFDFQSIFIFLGLMGCILYILSNKLIQETAPSLGNSFPLIPLLKRLLFDAHIWSSAALVAGFNALIFATYAEGPFIFMTSLHLTPREYSWFGILLGVLMYTGSLLAKKLIGRGLVAQTLIYLGLSIILLSGIMYVGLQFTHFIQWQPGYQIAALLGAFGLLFFGIVLALPSTLSQSLVQYQDCLGRAGAIFSMLYYLLLSALLGLFNVLPKISVWTLGYFILGMGTVMLAIQIGKGDRIE